VAWDGADLVLTGDPERLRGAIAAMVQAAAWWGQRGPVHVRASRTTDEVEIEVGRAGTDLTPAEAEHLFAVRRPGEGAGAKLGLHVARGVAAAQGGSLTAEVAGGFSLRLVVPGGVEPAG
jgi:K+-sensing histidine kinase KdpD